MKRLLLKFAHDRTFVEDSTTESRPKLPAKVAFRKKYDDKLSASFFNIHGNK